MLLASRAGRTSWVHLVWKQGAKAQQSSPELQKRGLAPRPQLQQRQHWGQRGENPSSGVKKTLPLPQQGHLSEPVSKRVSWELHHPHHRLLCKLQVSPLSQRVFSCRTFTAMNYPGQSGRPLASGASSWTTRSFSPSSASTSSQPLLTRHLTDKRFFNVQKTQNLNLNTRRLTNHFLSAVKINYDTHTHKAYF